MPRPSQRLKAARLASLSLLVLALVRPWDAHAQTAQRVGAGRGDTPVYYTQDRIEQDKVNDVVILSGHVQLVQGTTMLLADRVVWNQATNLVTATGDVKLVDEKGDIYFGQYIEVTDNMREGFIENVSALLADNTRMAGRHAERREGKITEIDRGVYSACALCAEDPTRPPTWQLKAREVIHDSEEKRIYYHDATMEINGFPVLWTPYFSTYDPSVKRAEGFLEAFPGYRSQLGFYFRSSYYFDIAPDIDATLETGYFQRQGPLLGGQYRQRFENGQIELSGSITQSDIRQYPTPLNKYDKTVRGHIFGKGDFDIDDHWRTGFEFGRSLDNIYVLKYGYSSQQILPSQVFAEGFYGRNYFNGSVYSFQDLRPGITEKQPYALPYIHFSLLGEPGEFLGGRWADTGSVLTTQRFPGQAVQRLSNQASWDGQYITPFGLVTEANASLQTDYYWTQNPQADPITGRTTAAKTAGRFFPQGVLVERFPLTRPIGYAQFVVEPVVSLVVGPNRANNRLIPNEDSQNIELDQSNLFAGNRFPGVDRIDDGTRVAYGGRVGLYNLGTGYTSIFLGQSYRFTGNAIFPTASGLRSGGSDYVGQIEIYPGRLLDIDYRFRLSNDLKEDRLQEVNFRIGPERYGVFGTYLSAAQVDTPNFTTLSRNELTLAAYYRINDNWSVSGSQTAKLSHPRAVLRYTLSAGYNDDCSSFTFNISHDQTLPVGGTSGTAFFIQFSLKTLGVFRSPMVN